MSARNALLGIVVFSVSVGAHSRAFTQNQAGTDLTTEAEALIDRMVARYGELVSYQDRVEMSMDVAAGEDAGFIGAGMMPTQHMELTLMAPNRIAFENEQVALLCDGQTLWISMPMFGQFIEREAPATWEEIMLAPGAAMFLGSVGHPVLQLLIRKDNSQPHTFGEISDVSTIEHVSRDGQKATLIKGTMEVGQLMMSDKPVPFEVWINDETGLLLESRVDYTDAYNAMMQQMEGMYGVADEDDEVEGNGEAEEDAAPPFTKYVMVTNVKSTTINEDIPDARFAFRDMESSEKVESFRIPGMGPSQQIRLVGREAPDFTLTMLDEKELTLSSLRGNVVLLDFWATWCAPCVAALPHVQEIHEHFEGRPVVVLGVNRDMPGALEHIISLLERKKVTFDHVLDEAGVTATNYHVTGIPSSVIIDKDGIVQDVGMGFMPGKEKELIAKIDKLLKGENVYDDEEVARQVEELGEEGDGADTAAFFQNPKASRELREAIIEGLGETDSALTKLDAPKGLGLQAWQIQLIDVDGDGKPEIVMPEGIAIRIVELDGSQPQRITLEGLSRSSTIQSCKALGHGDELRWIVTSTKMVMLGKSSTVSISMHDRSGASLWTFSPTIPKGAQAYFGEIVLADLDGQAGEEVAVTLQASRFDESRPRQTMFNGPTAQSAHLLVLDQQGRLLAHQSSDSVFGVLVTDAPDGEGQALLCTTQAGPVWLRLTSKE